MLTPAISAIRLVVTAAMPSRRRMRATASSTAVTVSRARGCCGIRREGLEGAGQAGRDGGGGGARRVEPVGAWRGAWPCSERSENLSKYIETVQTPTTSLRARRELTKRAALRRLPI